MGIDSVQPIDLSSVGTTTADEKRRAARYVVSQSTSRADAATLLAMLGLDKQPPRKTRQRSVWPSDLAAKRKGRESAGPGAVVEQAWTDRARCRYEPERWWSDDDKELGEAKTLCVTCPVRRECAQRAHDEREKVGMVAGFDLSTPTGRGELRAYLGVTATEPQARTVTCPGCGDDFTTTRKKTGRCGKCERAKSSAMTDAAPVREYVEWLRDECGLTVTEIGKAAGVPMTSVRGVLRKESRSVRLVNARRILALQPQGVAP